MIGKVLGLATGVIAMFLVISFLFSYPLMLLWNGCLVPAIPALEEVGWLQMWGISILIGALTRSNVEVKNK